MQKIKNISIFCIIMTLLLSSCNINEPGNRSEQSNEFNGTTLEVVTPYSRNISNADKFREEIVNWEEATGNRVINNSVIFDEASKKKVLNDFETSSEPDVLFFFTGADASSFIEASKVVSLNEIRELYPDYAGNMDDEKLPKSLVDGNAYAVPVDGFWEALFINTEVLSAAGVAIPGDNYTWEQFLNDCEAIKNAGFIPIAAALGHVPHYWWENAVFNYTTLETHLVIPASVDEPAGQAWLRGIQDIKKLYDNGFFPVNTLTMTDDESFQFFARGQAAFLLDGSWKVGEIVSFCKSLSEEALDKFDITFVPTRGNRRATDLIGGLSMGYYITRKAWNNPEKRAAAISFVEHMTKTEIVLKFAGHTATALAVKPDFVESPEFNSLQTKAINMVSRVTSYTGAVQDNFQGRCREPIFDGIADILVGDVKIEDALKASFMLYERYGY